LRIAQATDGRFFLSGGTVIPSMIEYGKPTDTTVFSHQILQDHSLISGRSSGGDIHTAISRLAQTAPVNGSAISEATLEQNPITLAHTRWR
jgi:hypothetical protein